MEAKYCQNKKITLKLPESFTDSAPAFTRHGERLCRIFKPCQKLKNICLQIV